MTTASRKRTDRRSSGTERAPLSVPESRKGHGGQLASYLLPAAVLVLAFFLRVHRLPSVPFGWHLDEATKGLLARDVLAGEYHPVFFTAFTGRDALYVYLEAAAFALFGEGFFAARLLSAFAGVLTVTVTYALGKTLFGRRVGVLSAALLAVSLWHLIASRNAYRAVLQPLVQLPVLWFLFRAWCAKGRRSWGESALAGLFLGLSQYTYTAARAFPVFVLALLFLSPSVIARRWRSLVVTGVVAFVVILPLGVYFFQHPADFYGRAAQISVFSPGWTAGDPAGRLWQSIKETGRMFTIWGDPNYRFNIAGRPVFGALDGFLFWTGLPLCLCLAFRSEGVRRVAYAMLFPWLGIMLLPMLLSAEGLPYYQRAVGILPAIYFFPALLLDSLVSLIERRLAVGRRTALLLCHAGLLLFTILLTIRVYCDYFSAWHMALRNDDDRRVAMVYVADYLAKAPPEQVLYLSTEYPQHPTLAFLAPERYDGIHWFDAQQCLPLPPTGARATYLFLMENAPLPSLMARVSDLRRVETGLDRFGRPVFEVYCWEGGDLPQPADQSPALWSPEVTVEPGGPQGLRHSIDLPVDLGHVIAFLGHDRSADAVGPGEMLEVVLYWRLLRRPDHHCSMFAHLLDSQSRIVAEYDANRYVADFWNEQGGELLLSYFPLRVNPDTPPGEYRFEIGVYDQATGERLPVIDGGEEVADRLLLRPVDVR